MSVTRASRKPSRSNTSRAAASSRARIRRPRSVVGSPWNREGPGSPTASAAALAPCTAPLLDQPRRADCRDQADTDVGVNLAAGTPSVALPEGAARTPCRRPIRPFGVLGGRSARGTEAPPGPAASRCPGLQPPENLMARPLRYLVEHGYEGGIYPGQPVTTRNWSGRSATGRWPTSRVRPTLYWSWCADWRRTPSGRPPRSARRRPALWASPRSVPRAWPCSSGSPRWPARPGPACSAPTARASYTRRSASSPPSTAAADRPLTHDSGVAYVGQSGAVGGSGARPGDRHGLRPRQPGRVPATRPTSTWSRCRWSCWRTRRSACSCSLEAADDGVASRWARLSAGDGQAPRSAAALAEPAPDGVRCQPHRVDARRRRRARLTAEEHESSSSMTSTSCSLSPPLATASARGTAGRCRHHVRRPAACRRPGDNPGLEMPELPRRPRTGWPLTPALARWPTRSRHRPAVQPGGAHGVRRRLPHGRRRFPRSTWSPSS